MRCLSVRHASQLHSDKSAQRARANISVDCTAISACWAPWACRCPGSWTRARARCRPHGRWPASTRTPSDGCGFDTQFQCCQGDKVKVSSLSVSHRPFNNFLFARQARAPRAYPPQCWRSMVPSETSVLHHGCMAMGECKAAGRRAGMHVVLDLKCIAVPAVALSACMLQARRKRRAAQGAAPCPP